MLLTAVPDVPPIALRKLAKVMFLFVAPEARRKRSVSAGVVTAGNSLILTTMVAARDAMARTIAVARKRSFLFMGVLDRFARPVRLQGFHPLRHRAQAGH